MPHAASSTDDELLDLARHGDQKAFRQIVERYEGQVAATVIGMLGRTPEADDVGQETFIRLYKALHKFRGDAALGTYITRIAINQSLKAIKRRQSWTQRFFSRDDEMFGEEAVAEVASFEEEERADLVRASLDKLRPDHRAVVVLRMMEGYSTRETAEMLNIAEGTVMSRLSRALKKLETVLAPVLRQEK